MIFQNYCTTNFLPETATDVQIPKIFEKKLVNLKNKFLSIDSNNDNNINSNNNTSEYFNLNFDTSFLDDIGSFLIFTNVNNYNNNSLSNDERKSLINSDEKWILINKLIKKAYLLEIKHNKLIDLDYEILMNQQNFLKLNSNSNLEQDKKLLIETELDYLKNKNINQIINLLSIEINNENYIKDDNNLKFEEFFEDKIEENLKIKLLKTYESLRLEGLYLKRTIFIKDEEFNFSESINVRCPHISTSAKMINLINRIKNEKDSIGGIASCIIRNIPRSLGEPCFDKFEAELAKAMLSIPATKGFEIGSGFEGTKLK